MTVQTEPNAKTQFRIHPSTRPGHVHLTVANLNRQLEFYQRVIGLKLHWKKGASVGLGVGNEDMLRLTEVPGARRSHGTTGLYHFAILLPDRRELARAIARLYSLRYPNYPTDHIMTKTTYLDDPEGNNIELYTESPEDGTMEFVNGTAVTRRADGTLSDGREALDVEALLTKLHPDDSLDTPMPEATRIGHFHLYVADLDQTMHFYHDVLGFDDMGIAPSFRMGMVSAGRYHHHIGFNTWVGEGVPAPAPDALGMRYFTFLLPNKPDLEQILERLVREGIPSERTGDGLMVRDPSQNRIVLTENV
jgi:catechol 2,3-dioxygenase